MAPGRTNAGSKIEQNAFSIRSVIASPPPVAAAWARLVACCALVETLRSRALLLRARLTVMWRPQNCYNAAVAALLDEHAALQSLEQTNLRYMEVRAAGLGGTEQPCTVRDEVQAVASRT